MTHFAFVGQGKKIRIHLFTGDRAKRKRRHEFGAGLGQDGAHPGAGLAQQACQLQAFIGGDAAGYDQKNALIFKHAHTFYNLRKMCVINK